MSDLPVGEKPKRRPRYAGKNPRAFHEKYKELNPERYAADIAKVLASGKTPAGTHRPILVEEILQVLAPQPGEIAADCTLGHGGHASRILPALKPGGRLFGLDVDPIEQPKTEARLRADGFGPDVFQTRLMNFAGLHKLLRTDGVAGFDVVLADFGVSSMQIDNPDRGFTFKTDGPLDLRLNPLRGVSAADLLSKLTADDLAELLAENADEANAARLAAGILEVRARAPITRTVQLADAVRTALAGFRKSPALHEADDTVRRVFQALRIAVNDEFGALDAFLRVLPVCLKPGGRVAILTFHSGEDRRVKKAFQSGQRDGTYDVVSDGVIRAGAEEVRANPRASSAKLRWAVRGPLN